MTDRTPARGQTDTTFDFVTDARDVIELDAVRGLEEVVIELREWDGEKHLDGTVITLDAHEVTDLISALEAARDKARS